MYFPCFCILYLILVVNALKYGNRGEKIWGQSPVISPFPVPVSAAAESEAGAAEPQGFELVTICNLLFLFSIPGDGKRRKKMASFLRMSSESSRLI